jgi:hypothetical protein
MPLQWTLAEVVLAFAKSCHKRGDVRLITKQEILAQASEKAQRALKPFSWQVIAPWENTKLRLPVVPDEPFGLEFLSLPQGPLTAWFLFEADTGSETVIPIDLKNTNKVTLFHKYLGYAASDEQGLVTERFGVPSFRVLTVTQNTGVQVKTDPETGEKRRITRLMSLQEAANLARGKRPPGFYLFADLAMLLEHPDVLAMPWQNASGKTVVLAPKL